MINLNSKEAMIDSLVEARKNSYDDFASQIEIAKSIHGEKFAQKIWEYFGVNIEFMNTTESINSIDEKISPFVYKPLNENKK